MVIEKFFTEQICCLKELLETDYILNLKAAVKIIADALNNKNKILIAGNGGSAAEAQHFAAELLGRFEKDRNGYPAIDLTANSPVITCIGNDYDFNMIFSRQIEALGCKGDVFIGMTTSGKSEDILNAIYSAKKRGMIVVGMVGINGKSLNHMCDCLLVVPNTNTARIQEAQLTTIHTICYMIENNLSTSV